MRINSRKVKLSVELNTRATVHITLVWHSAPWERTVPPLNKSNNSEPNMLVLKEVTLGICFYLLYNFNPEWIDRRSPSFYWSLLSHHNISVKQIKAVISVKPLVFQYSLTSNSARHVTFSGMMNRQTDTELTLYVLHVVLVSWKQPNSCNNNKQQQI